MNTGTSNLGLAIVLGNRAKAKSEAERRHCYDEVGSEIIPLTEKGRKRIWEEMRYRRNRRNQLTIQQQIMS